MHFKLGEFRLEPSPRARTRKKSRQRCFFEALEGERKQALGSLYLEEKYREPMLNAMLKPVMDYLDYDHEALHAGYMAFLADTYARGIDPACPLWFFVRHLSRWVSIGRKSKIA